MFGRNWEPGQATILARKSILHNSASTRYEFIGDVQPEGGAPAFRATFKGLPSNIGFKAPEVGSVAPVLCDPKHQKVKFDFSNPEVRWDTALNAERKDFDKLRRDSRGTEVASPAKETVSRYPASPADPLERLQKLADLHDRGDLTDAEFATEKARILSEG